MKFILWSDDPNHPVLHNATKALLEHTRPCSVEILPYKPKRNERQNALLWSLYQQIIDRGGEAMRGWRREDLHEYFLGEHFGWAHLSMAGRSVSKPERRSSKLNKVEFAEFVDFILQRMAEQGMVLEIRYEFA